MSDMNQIPPRGVGPAWWDKPLRHLTPQEMAEFRDWWFSNENSTDDLQRAVETVQQRRDRGQP